MAAASPPGRDRSRRACGIQQNALFPLLLQFGAPRKGESMTPDAFRHSLRKRLPPEAIPTPLRALWWAAKGDWNRAHEIAQSEDGADAAWVHAYLHRVEGDLANARYWYARAGSQPPTTSTEAEWDAIVEMLLADAG
jgi:hypothetical protein